jgi:hypothetical protein
MSKSSDKLDYEKVCPICGLTFKVKYGKHKQFCSIPCRYKSRYNRNKDKILNYKKKYYCLNKDKEKHTKLLYNRKKRKEDIHFRLSKNLRSRLGKAITKGYKTGSAINDLGCSINFFKTYLENLFELDMTWENYGRGYGKWSIDHIKPVIDFDLTNKEHIQILCHYTNLRPLWNHQNSSLGAKHKSNHSV